MSLSHGAEANHSGRGLEMAIEYEFRARGVAITTYTVDADNLDFFAPRRLIKNVPYRSVASTNSRSEFVYRDSNLLLDLRIECKSQIEEGSVDEKLSYLIDNAIEAMPEPNIWVILDGNGARNGIVSYIKRKAQRAVHKNIRVFSLVESKQAIKRLLQDGVA